MWKLEKISCRLLRRSQIILDIYEWLLIFKNMKSEKIYEKFEKNIFTRA